MLSQITIRNFGLIDQISLEFSSQLNVLTGETGAGKSIVIDALRFALGERPKSPPARNPETPSVVEAVFEIKDKSLRKDDLLAEYFQDDGADLIIQRQLLPDGKNKIKINGFAVTISQLKDIGDRLVDFHGPHDHQMLFSEGSHVGILDQLTDFGEHMEAFRGRYQEYARLQTEWQDLQALSLSRERDLEMLSHQVKELEQIPLDQAKYDELSQDMVKIKNAEKLYHCVSELIGLFEGQEVGLSEMIRRAFAPMRTLNQIDEKTASLSDHLAGLQDNSEQLLAQLRDYLSSLSFRPEESEDLNRRYDIYEDIRRKYGPSLEEAKRFYEEAKQKYDLMVNFEHNDRELKEKIENLRVELKKVADKLTKARKKTAQSLKMTIEKELRDLGIEHVAFEARVTPEEFHKDGSDKVVFYISPNAGEDMKPLSQIVSSGEAARTMLALKKAMTRVDPIPVLVFDEIDAQIGGRLGTITGGKLKELSKDRQVLLITHLPQIASFGDRHFKVTKAVSAGRTVTRVQELDAKARVQELSQMMAGKDENRISVSHAEEMLSRAQQH
ncbi:MAG: DNA repair protein RecN [Candidatus Omnitrophota bacterium]|nr:DNA repair protein RecN [Candidatus Omnitrophota bacterium]MDZ4241504.1 DNA repair protein RecN [Candidatus Omnitrophota bacterium]